MRWLADILTPAVALALAGAVLARAIGGGRRFGAMAGSAVAAVLIFATLRAPWPSWDHVPEQASALLGIVLTLAGIAGASWGALRTRAALLAGHGPDPAAFVLGLTWLICAAFTRSTLAGPLAAVTAEIAAGVVGAMLLWGALLTACHRLVIEVEGAWRTRADLTRLVSEQRKRIGEQDEIIRREIQQRAVLEERERLTRDIHDGIGSQLVSLLARVRSGSISPTDLEAEIEGGLNDLRLIVDSLDHAGEAFLAALSLAQTRLRPQIEGAGLTFDWVQADGSLPRTVAPRTTMNILRILQEALANAVKHARADRVRVMIEGRTAPSIRTDYGWQERWGRGRQPSFIYQVSSPHCTCVCNRAKFGETYIPDAKQCATPISPTPGMADGDKSGGYWSLDEILYGLNSNPFTCKFTPTVTRSR